MSVCLRAEERLPGWKEEEEKEKEEKEKEEKENEKEKEKRGPFGALPETKMCFAVVVVHKFFKPTSPRPGHHHRHHLGFLFCCCCFGICSPLKALVAYSLFVIFTSSLWLAELH